MDRQNFDSTEAAKAAVAVEALVHEVGLTLGEPEQRTIRRIRRGKRFHYRRPDGSPGKQQYIIGRLNALAMPPASDRSYPDKELSGMLGPPLSLRVTASYGDALRTTSASTRPCV